MVEHQTLAGILGAAMAGTSIMLKQAMMSLKSAASSPDLPEYVWGLIMTFLEGLETNVC